jgi:phosphoglycolate phosphatase
MSPRLPKAIVFDFDLTLADSTLGFVECHEFTAAQVGLPMPDAEAVGRTIGTPLPLAFRALYGIEDEGTSGEYIRLYQERADAVMTDLTAMLDGAADAIHSLSNAGILLGIVSQKLRYRVEAVLQREALLDAFATVLGAEDVPEFKPDPGGLLLAIERLRVAPAEALYVGDTLIDAEAAQRGGVPFVAVLTGFARTEDFAAYRPLTILASVRALPAYLGIALPVSE